MRTEELVHLSSVLRHKCYSKTSSYDNRSLDSLTNSQFVEGIKESVVDDRYDVGPGFAIGIEVLRRIVLADEVMLRHIFLW